MLTFVTWTADPVLFSLGPLHIRWYGLMFAIGFWLGTNIVAKMFKHEGAPESWVGILLIWAIGATIVGARLGHVFFYEWDYYSQHPAEIVAFWKGGLASHGGTIALVISVFLFSWFTTKRSPMWTFDRFVIPIALVGALIRMGNLMNSEIYGYPTTLPWGFRYLNSREWLIANNNTGLPLDAFREQLLSNPFMLEQTQACHPTQIYEALAYITLFGLLMWMYWKKNAEERPGLIFGTFFTWLFTARFLIEFVKNPQVDFERDMVLNMGQLLSIPFIIAGITMIVVAFIRPRQHLTFPNKFAPEPKKKG